MRKTRHRLTWGALVLLISLAGCLPGKSSQGTIAIGAVGALPEYDDLMFKGIRLYLDQLNKAGGIHGKKVELIELYDQGDPEVARARALELVERQVLCVIGHSWSSQAIRAGEVYKEHGVPAITASATAPGVTRDNEWYFRTVFNNDSQASFVAHYISQVLKQNAVSVIWNQDDYGTTLLEAFERTAPEAGIAVRYQWSFDDQDPNLSQVFDAIVSDLQSKPDVGTLFLAVQYSDGIELIRRIRDLGLQNLLVADDAVGSQTFPGEFDPYPLEQQQPGFYSDGVYAPTFLIFDIANQRAQDFRVTFMNQYGQEPDYMAAVYYDAVALAVEAIRQSGADSTNLAEGRQKIRDYLASLDDARHVFASTTGPLYFDANRDAVTAAQMGVFKGEKLISAPIQLQPVTDLNRVADLEKALQEGQVVRAGERYMYKTRVVYAGMDINDISDLNTGKFSYTLDLYLWFRYQGQPGSDPAAGFDDADIEFINTSSKLKLDKPIVENATDDGMVYRAYQVKSTFLGDFDFHDYPFDQQVLSVRFRHRVLTGENLIYVVDLVGMPRLTDGTLLEHLRTHTLNQAKGWNINKVLVFQDTLTRNSTLGNPRMFEADTTIAYSRFNAEVYVKRDTLSYSVKNLFPILVLIVVSYVVMFMPGPAIMPRTTTNITVILTVALFSNRLSSDLPQVGYLSALEYVFFLVYVLALYGVLLGLMDYRYEKKAWIKRLNLISRIAYPAVILVAATIVTLIYLL